MLRHFRKTLCTRRSVEYFRKGIGEDGTKHLEAFIEGGGLVVAWGRSTQLFFDGLTFGEGDEALEIELPIRDDTDNTLFCSRRFVRARVALPT